MAKIKKFWVGIAHPSDNRRRVTFKLEPTAMMSERTVRALTERCGSEGPVCWDVSTDIKYLTPDVLVLVKDGRGGFDRTSCYGWTKFKGIEVPLIDVDAENVEQAIEEYKRQFSKAKTWKLKKCSEVIH